MTSYRIKEVADRSGFTPATLRYYEDIGLMPAPARTASGYRRYDEQVLARLAFITRAKQLGCTLEEISELVVAWDGGRCGPPQDRLRALVGDKVGSARDQIAALMTLTAELQQAASNLERHRPDGPCDDRCGCTDMGDDASSLAVLLTSRSTTAPQDAPIACTLGSGSMRRQLDEWEAVLASVRSRTALDEGVRLEFEPTVDLAELSRLAVAEQDCCRFFSFAITVDERGIGLEVRAATEARDLVDALFGAPA